MSDGRGASIRCRSRDGLSPSSRCTGRTTRVGGSSRVSVERGAGDVSGDELDGLFGATGARRSGRSPSGFVGAAGVVTLDLTGFDDSPVGPVTSGFPESPPPTIRGGRETAPVGLLSGVPPLEVSAGDAPRGSRPLKILERRNSSSSGAPGVRVAAPVVSGRPAVGKERIGGRAIAGRSGRSPAPDLSCRSCPS